MLIFETEGFFEVEDDRVEELYRSTDSVSLAADDDLTFDVQALVCRHRGDDQQRCHIGFFCRDLKRAMVFVIKDSSPKAQVKLGLEVAKELGLQMQPVKLNLSAAMRQVVLRDIPGLQTPEYARKLREEKSEMLTEMQAKLDEEGPESAAGKKAILKLNAEKRLDDKSSILRELLCNRFAPEPAPGNAGLEALSAQVNDLTERLKKAVAECDQERSQRKISEEIMAAAEKRIQELEEVLVDVETKSSDTIKHKQKIVQLEARIKELDKQLIEAQKDLETERDQKEQLIGDVQSTQQLVAALEKELADVSEIASGAVDFETAITRAEESITKLQADLESKKTELDAQQSARKQLEEKIKTLESQIKELTAADTESGKKAEKQEAQLADAKDEIKKLQQQLKAGDKQADSEQEKRQQLEEQIEELKKVHTESVQKAKNQDAQLAEAQAEIKKLQQELKNRDNQADKEQGTQQQLEEQTQTLQDQLTDTESRLASLQDELEQERKNHDKASTAWSKERDALQQEIAALAKEQRAATEATSPSSDLEQLKEELDQEKLIRKRLEKGAAADQKRIDDLEQQLGGSQSGLTLTAGKSALAAQEVELLQAQLRDSLNQAEEDAEVRADLERELDDAHTLIGNLEQALKEARESKAGDDTEKESQQTAKLNKEIQRLQKELEQTREAKQQAVTSQGSVEQRLNDMEQLLARAVLGQATAPATQAAPAPTPSEPPAPSRPASKPLPHELRPAPKKGANFHPDWDLSGLPCQSVDQILQAWESVFNVQLSLEGYPSQYCAAFVVVLKTGKQKRLFLVFNLTKDKHVLVSVPAKQPNDEASLKKAVSEGLKFLQLSGFEMEKITADNLSGALSPYFAKG